MAKKIKLLLLFLAPLLCSAQTLHSYLRQGNESYKKQNFKQADSLYRKALKVDSNSVKAKFNLPLGQFTTSVTLVKIPTFMIAAWKIYP